MLKTKFNKSIPLILYFTLSLTILLNLDHFSFWYDELGLLDIISNPWKVLLKDDLDSIHPPLFIYLCKVWYQFGQLFYQFPTEWFLKLLPFIFFNLTYFKLLTLLNSTRSKSVFTIFYWTTPTILLYAGEFRPYTAWAYFFISWIIDIYTKPINYKSNTKLLLALGMHHLTAPFSILILAIKVLCKQLSIKELKFFWISLIPLLFSLKAIFDKILSIDYSRDYTISIKRLLFYTSSFIDTDILFSNFFYTATYGLLVIFIYFFSKMPVLPSLGSSIKFFFVLSILYSSTSKTESTRYFYPFLAFFPVFLAGKFQIYKFKIPSTLLITFTAVANSIVLFIPKNGFIDFERNPNWNLIFQSIQRDFPKETKVTICNRWDIHTPDHYSYYFKRFDISQPKERTNCFFEKYEPPQVGSLYIIVKGSPWWKDIRDIKGLGSSRKYKILYNNSGK